MEETLICTLCGFEKPINEFYKNNKMPSGYANQCKECVKKRAKIRQHRLIKNSEWRESERIRSKNKYYRLNYKNKQKEWDSNKKWKATTTYKGLHKKLKKDGLIMPNETIHHWNYNYLEDYFILKKEDHRKIHRFIEFDSDSLCFKYNGVLLGSRELHEICINDILK